MKKYAAFRKNMEKHEIHSKSGMRVGSRVDKKKVAPSMASMMSVGAAHGRDLAHVEALKFNTRGVFIHPHPDHVVGAVSQRRRLLVPAAADAHRLLRGLGGVFYF